MPRFKLMVMMPPYMQAASVDINRMRSRFIKLMTILWKSYSKLIIGKSCPVFGSFTSDGKIIPSSELSQIACLDPDICIEKLNLPPLDLAALAQATNLNESIVLQILKTIIKSIKVILNSKFFQTIKLTLAGPSFLTISKGSVMIE